MVELTYGELKQGLICCTVYRDCKGCPLFNEDTIQTATADDLPCTTRLLAAAMNCINVMEKDLEAAKKLADEWEAVATLHEKSLIELQESLDHRGKTNG